MTDMVIVREPAVTVSVQQQAVTVTASHAGLRMTDLVIVRDPEVTVAVQQQDVIVTASQAGLPGPPGPPGPPGRDGLGAISTDPGNAIATGSDGGLFCPAVISSTLHW